MNALETKVLELIGEDLDSPDVFVDTAAGMAPIRDSLSDAIQEIVTITGGHKRDYFLPLRQEQAFYRFALNHGDLGWITDAWLVGKEYRLEQTDLIRLTAHDTRWMITNADPRSYLQLGQDIVGFWPKPSGNSDVVRLTIVEIPEPYVYGEDKIKVRDSFQYACTQYAVSEYWASRGDAKTALEHYTLYLDALGIRQLFDQSPERSYRFTTAKDPWPTVTS